MRNIIAAMILSSAIVYPGSVKAAGEFFVDKSNQVMTKLEALKVLISDKGEAVFKCYEVELSPSLSVVKKKEKK